MTARKHKKIRETLARLTDLRIFCLEIDEERDTCREIVHLLTSLKHCLIHQRRIRSQHGNNTIGIGRQSTPQVVIGIVGHREGLLRVVIVTIDAPREVRLVTIGQRQTCAPRRRVRSAQGQEVPLRVILVIRWRILGIIQ